MWGKLVMSKETDKKIVKIFFTGGLDSSFRVTQLSKMPVVILPYYISDSRESEKFELSAIKNITKALQLKPDTMATFEPLIIFHKKDRPKDAEITQAFLELYNKGYVKKRGQHEWLALVAQGLGGEIERSSHSDDKITGLMYKLGGVNELTDPVTGTYFAIDESKTDKNLFKLTKHFRFPLLKMTKLEMAKEYEKMGCADVMAMTWFCHRPTKKDEACGFCGPCIYTIEEGMPERFTSKALRRYKYKNFHKILYRLRRMLKL